MDIAQHIQKIALTAVPFFLGITCHEFAHGYVSWLLGDPTAKNAGRLTLNPLKHLDLLGTLSLIITQIIGWAKPVPIDPRYYKNPKKDCILVSVAGPLANIFLSVLFYGLYLFFGETANMFSPYLQIKLFAPLATISIYGVIINLILALFNLLPIPPLDGSKILLSLLPPQAALTYMRLEPYGFLLILTFALFNGFQFLFDPIIGSVFRFLF